MYNHCCRLCGRKSLSVPEWTFWPQFTHRLTLRGQRISNWGCLALAILFDVSYLTKDHRIMKCDCLVFSKACSVRESTPPPSQKTQPVFPVLFFFGFLFVCLFWRKLYFPPQMAFCRRYQPECGQSLSLSFLTAESASQHLALVPFLWSPCAGCVKCYYRLLPLRFVSPTVTFTGNLRETTGKNSSQAVLGSLGLSPSERKVAI